MDLRARIDWLSGLVLVLPVVGFGSFFFEYAVNVPKWDDHALKAFLLHFQQADTLHEKIFQIFRQHNEHRIVYDRLLAGLDYLLTGRLNYIHLMLVGNLSLIGLLLVFCWAIRQGGGSLWMALPVSLLLFNLSQWENMFWGMAALQNFTVITLVMTVFYLLCFRENSEWWAVGLAIVATGTSGNGLLVWPVGLMILLHKRQSISTLRWLLAAVVCIRLYFLGYKRPEGNPATEGLGWELVRGWFVFNGSALEALPIRTSQALCFWSGTVITLLIIGNLAVILHRYLQGKQPTPWESFFVGGSVFLLTTGLIVAYTRLGFGHEILLTSRYKICSLTLMALSFGYLIISQVSIRNIVALVLTIFCAILAFFSYSTFRDETVQFRKFQLTSQFNWTYTRSWPVAVVDPITQQFVRNSSAFYDNYLPELYHFSVKKNRLLLDSLRESENMIFIQQKTFPVLGLRDEGAYLFLRSRQRSYLFPTQQQLSGSKWGWIQSKRLFSTGFTAFISKSELEAGQYTLNILVVRSGNHCELFSTGRQLVSVGRVGSGFRKNW